MKNFIFGALLVLIFSETSAQDFFYKKDVFSQYESQVEKKQIIGNQNTIGEYPILKTGEEMKVIFSKVSYSTGVSVPLGRVAMISQREKKWLFGLDVTANLNQAQSNDWVDEPCKRDDFIWKRSIGNSLRDVNCVSINHVVNHYVNPTGDYQQIYALLKDEGIEIPPTVVRVTFTRYAPNTRRLVSTVDINPEQFGVPRDPTTSWGTNGWHKNLISRDEKRVDFIENVKRWAIDVQERMDAAFNKNPKAFADIRGLNSYLEPIAKEFKVSSEYETVEDKLLKLKNLYEKGLLTEVQFNEQVKTVLNKR